MRDALRGAGLTEFLPTYQVESRWTDRTTITTRPLFPGYIFARFERAAANDVRLIRGVVQILGIGVPEAIPDKDITNLQRLIDSQLPLSPCAYVAGEAVTITSGPLTGCQGVIVRTAGPARVVVLCEILRRGVRVEVDAAQLEISPEPKR